MRERIVERYENLPLTLRFVLALPVLNSLSGGLYRWALKRPVKGLIWVALGGIVLWPMDLLSLIFLGRLRVCV